MLTGHDTSRHAAITWCAVAATVLAAVAFYWAQNRWQPVGGAMALPKALWLMDAVLLWLVVPLCIAADRRLAIRWRRPFQVLAVLMVFRGLAELWMLYVSLNWSPWYGIAHDLLCIAVLAGYCVQLMVSGAGADRPWALHAGVTALAFAPEIYFAWYMQAHFTNQGDAAIYFVPDDPSHAFALNVTTAAVVCFSTYLAFFLVRWLHATPDGNSTRPA